MLRYLSAHQKKVKIDRVKLLLSRHERENFPMVVRKLKCLHGHQKARMTISLLKGLLICKKYTQFGLYYWYKNTPYFDTANSDLQCIEAVKVPQSISEFLY